MKLQTIKSKVVKFAKKKAKGKKIKDAKLRALRKLLAEKRSGYKEKRSATSDKAKRLSLRTKLKVVNAHIGKIDKLLADD